ncbi:Pr6Pr family membrane protein [Terracidiphilus gabretensis]|uniref:Pr6Pr family membrane protein n=1 Tax=Terracidiphilus gabretensis TaxID=1577687 RepID=UPI0018D2535D|nr:Pr6Pr family membrane protein [Terracidiphilus gabretensis]
MIAFAVIAQLMLLITGGADANSGILEPTLGLGGKLVRFFSYFTIQSNLLVMIDATLLALYPDRDNRWRRILRLDALTSIVVTGLVFTFVLAKIVHLTGLAYGITVCLHYISPVIAPLCWLLFGPRPRITWSVLALTFVWPVLWILYTFTHGAMTGWYPYPFLNPDKLGYPAAVANTMLVLIAAAILGLIFKALDHWLPANPSAESSVKRS